MPGSIIKHVAGIDMNLEPVKGELALTVVLCVLLVVAALLIADLIGAINVIG